MLDQNTIIDAPLDGRLIHKSSYLWANKWDGFFNLFLIFITAVFAITGTTSSDVLLLAGVLFFFLGVYQLLSCAVGAFRGNKAKQVYGFIAITYVLFLFLGLSSISKLNDDVLVFLFLFFIPAGMAFYYTRLCYLAYQRAKELEVSDTLI